MLPGKYTRLYNLTTWLILLSSFMAFIFSFYIFVISSVEAWNAIPPPEKDTIIELLTVIRRNALSDPGTAFGFVIATGATVIGIRRHMASQKRENELRNVFGQGLWGGYAINFFGRAIASLKANNIDPIVVFLSPSYSMLEFQSSEGFSKLLSSLPDAFARKGIELEPIHDDIGFRRSQQFSANVHGESRRIIIDLPTTFASFYYGINKLLKARSKYISDEDKEEYFSDFKKSFFDEIVPWQKVAYEFDYEVIDINNLEVDKIVDDIIISINDIKNIN